MTDTTTTLIELTPGQAEVVSATLPLVGAHIDEISAQFYRRLFDAHPELLRNLFNRGNQAQGAQQRALAASIATFATHLVDPDLPHPAELLSRIGHKHASLGIVAEQYEVVHDHLFAAIVAVLGADTVTGEVAEAWDRVYWIMADTLIDLERDLYAAAGAPEGDVYRRAQVTSRVDDPSGAVLVTVRTAGGFGSDPTPGRYVSVGVTMPDGARQLRQYSLISAPRSEELTFAVKPVVAAIRQPAGEVSSWIDAHLRTGDVIDVSLPSGDLPIPEEGKPLFLISAGIGVTPMISILEFLVADAPATSVRVLHADRNDRSHPLRQRQRELTALLPNAALDVWYEESPSDRESGVHHGFLELDAVADDAHVYLCGNTGFVQAVRSQLIALGVPAGRVHCELFSPNDWLL